MKNRFGTPQYLSGEAYRDPNDPEQPNAESRTWGEAAIDTASDVLGPTVGLGRTITHAARAATDLLPESVQKYTGTSAEGPARDVDVAVGGVEKAIKDWQSPYSKEIGQASLLPGYGERSFWDSPVASSAKLAAGMVPYAGLALLTGGSSVAGQVGGAAVQGVFGAAEGWNELQDYTDQTPIEKLRKESPAFLDYERMYPGNEKAARQALYKDTVDVKALLASGVANAAEFGALLDGLNKTQRSLAVGMARFIPGIGKFIGKSPRIAGAVGGTLEGVVSGGAEGITDNYMEQVAKVRRGSQEAIDVSELPKGFWQGAALGPGIGAWHAARPTAKKWDSDVGGVLKDQLDTPAPYSTDLPEPGGPPPGGYPSGRQDPIDPYAPEGGPPAPPPGPAAPAPFPTGMPTPGGPPPGGYPTGRQDPIAVPLSDPDAQPPAPPPGPATPAPFSTDMPPARGGTPPTGWPTGRTDPIAVPLEEEQALATGAPPTATGAPQGRRRRGGGQAPPTTGTPPSTPPQGGGEAIAAAPAAAPYTRVRPEAAPAAPVSEAVGPPEHPPGRALWQAGDYQHEVDVLPGAAEQGPDGRMYQQAVVNGEGTWLPADELHPVQQQRGSPVTEKARRAYEEHESKASAQQMRQASWQQESDRLYNAWQDAALDDRREGAGLVRNPPVAPRGMTSKGLTPESRLKIRGGLAVLNPKQRLALAANLRRRQGATGDADSSHVPESMRTRMTEGQWAALRDALDSQPDATIDLIAQPATGSVLEELQEHHRQRSEEEAARAAADTSDEALARRERGTGSDRRPATDHIVPATGPKPPRRVSAALRTEMAALEGSVRGYQANPRKKPSRWRALRRRAAAADRDLRAEGFQPRFVDQLGPQPAETVRASGITGPTLQERAGRQAMRKPKVEGERLTAPERQLASDIGDYNERVRALSDKSNRSERIKLKNLRERLVSRAGDDTVMLNAIRDLTPRKTAETEFNALVSDLSLMENTPPLDFMRSKFVLDTLDRMHEINRQRKEIKKGHLPLPQWLHSKIQAGVSKSQQAVEVVEDPVQKAYADARNWYLQHRFGVEARQGGEVSIDVWEAEAKRDRQRVTPEVRRLAEQVTSQAPPPAPEMEEQAVRRLERREEQARERAASGGAPVSGRQRLPTMKELLDQLRAGLKRKSGGERTKATRAGYTSNRETLYRVSNFIQMYRSFGNPAKFRKFLLDTMAVSGQRFPAQPKELRHRSVTEKARQYAIPMTEEEAMGVERQGTPQSNMIWPADLLDAQEKEIRYSQRKAAMARAASVEERNKLLRQWDLADRPREGTPEELAALRKTSAPQVSRTVLNKYRENVEKFYEAKEQQYKAIGRLVKFLDKAIERGQKDVAAFLKEHGIEGESITWTLPDAKRDRALTEDTSTMTPEEAAEVRQRSIMATYGKKNFAVGSNIAAHDHYNMTVDMLKLRETLVHALRGLEPAFNTKMKIKMDQTLRTSQGPILAQDLVRQYLSPLSATRDKSGILTDHIVDLVNMIDGDMDTIRDNRKLRSETTTDRYVEAGLVTGLDAEQSQEFRDQLLARTEEMPETPLIGGRKGTTAEEIANNVMQAKEHELQAQHEAAVAKGSNLTLDQRREQAAAALRAQFPLRSDRLPFRGVPRKANVEMFDGDGLPISNIPRREEFADERNQTPEQQAIDDAHAELRQPGEPSHPLIQAPETTRDALDRIGDMVAKGEADLPRQYITSDFLDQLATITSGTSIYHAPLDVVSNLGEDGQGYYNVDTDRVVVSADTAPQTYAQTTLHEITHAATVSMMSADHKFSNGIRDLLIRSVRKAIADGVNMDRLPRDLYGLHSPVEFIAELSSNPQFRDFLDTVSVPEHPVITGVRSALNAAYRMIRDAFRRLMGKHNADTALDVLFYDQSTVLGRADAMFKRSVKQMSRTGRPNYVPEHLQKMPPMEKVGDLYYGPVEGAKAFAKDLAEGFGHTAKRVGFHLKTTDKNRAHGLAWMTGSDMTQIGAPEFRRLTENTFATMEKIFAMGNELRDKDRRELKGIADIYNSWSRENREKVGRFAIDLTMHGAFTDVGLDHPKNQHVGKEDMAWEQVRQQHGAMQARHREVSALARGDEFLNRILKFGELHEEQIRKARLRDLIKFSSFIPEGLRPGMPEHDRLVDAIERLVSLEPERDAEGNAKRQTRQWLEQKLSKSDVDLIDKHVDVNDPVVKEIMRDLFNVPDIQRLQGPYLPLTRQGDWALSGEFTLPDAPNSTLLHGDVNRLTGEPLNEGKRAFKTKAEAQAYVKQVTEQLGITQINGGEVLVDAETGQRPMVRSERDTPSRPATRDPTKRAQRAGEGTAAERLALASEAQIEQMRAEGKNFEPRYWVQFQPKMLTMHANEYEAQKAYDGWRAKHPESVLSLTSPKDVIKYDARVNEQYVSTQMQKLINHMRQSDAYGRLDAQEQSALTRVMTLASETYAMRRGVKQRYLPRGYVEGASTNVLQSLDDYSSMATHYEAKVEHASELAVNSQAQKDYLKAHEYEAGDKNHLAHQRIYNAMQARIQAPKQNPRDTWLNRQIDRVLRITMLDKLPSIAYFTVNATEPTAVAAPLMMGRHSPMQVASMMWQMYKVFGLTKALRNAGKDMAEAMKKGQDKIDYLAEMNKAIDASKLDQGHKDGLKAMLVAASGRGVFDRSSSVEYQGGFDANANMVDRAADWAQGVFQGANGAIEAMNRFVTLGSAYMLEVNKNSSHEDAMRYAFRIAHNANGQYANYNAPEMFNKGPVARMMFQFKKYPQRIIMNYIRGAQGVIGLAKGETSAENIERAKQLVALLAVQFLLAGALGLPTELFAVPLNTMNFLGFTKYNSSDVSNGFRQWSADTFGVTGGAAASKGMLSTLLGLDMHSRMSQASMFSSGAARKTDPQNLPAILAGFFFGASASTGVELAQASQSLNKSIAAGAQGATGVAVHEFLKFAEKAVLFRPAADLLAAANGMTVEGARGPSGRQRQTPYSGAEAFVRGATGLRPLRESEGTEAAMAIRRASDQLKTERKGFVDNWVQSTPAQQAQMWSSIQAWNQGKPRDQQLTRSDLLKADATRTKSERQAVDKYGLAVDKQMKPFLPMGKAYATGA